MFDIPKKLEDAVSKDQLVIFVGAGLSRSCGFPTWSEIVKDVLSENVEYIEKSEALMHALDNEVLTPLEVLDKISKEKDVVFGTFEKKLKSKNHPSDLHKSLGGVSRRFITTNYDKLIENNAEISRVITWDSAYGLSKIDTENEFVVKIHGDIEAVDKCVIFSEQYEDLYSGEKLASFQIKKMLSHYTVLFIGFSFGDPFVKALFDYVGELMHGYGPKHYLISDEEANMNGVEVLNIGDYSNLESLVHSLALLKDSKGGGDNKELEFSEDDVVSSPDGSDLPPDVSGWVGREKEMSLLKNDNFKVIFITGIGGEGKSALASHYLNEVKNKSVYEVLDWKDFKEEGHKFQNKIITMIFSVADDMEYKDLVGLSDGKLVEIFFEKLGEKQAIFILDNVDSYVDLETFEPVKGVGILCEKALAISHKAKFIFTCRPFIRHAGVDFYQLSLSGLTEKDTVEYFQLGKPSIPKEKLIAYAKRAHALTKGHALWLSMIAAQAQRGEEKLCSFLENIISGDEINENDSSIMSEKVLGSIWGSLHDRDKLVLRTLAESVKSEELDDYAEVLSSEINYKNFLKAIKALKSLNLIVVKRQSSYIDLHPLVREFVRKNYQSSERKRFITLFINYYDKFVFVLKKKLSYKLSFDEFLNFTKKSELAINAGEYQEAVTTLWEVSSAMSAAGYVEEFLRVSQILFYKFSWSKNKVSQINSFEPLVQNVIQSAVEYGDDKFVDFLIEKLDSLIESKESEYIRLCYVKSYVGWFRGEYDGAIKICEEAIYLIERAGQSDSFGVGHNKALAYRDSGKEEGVERALNFFIKGNSLEDLVDENNIPDDGNGTMYGNAGRCLALKGEYDFAIICYSKSFYYIFIGDDSKKLLNLGYAASWMSELIGKAGDTEVASYFYKFALDCWERSSPIMRNKGFKNDAALLSSITCRSILSQEAWRIEKFCTEWVARKISVSFC